MGIIQFQGYKDTIFAINAQSNLFINGTNVVRLTSNPTGAAINEVFLDWLEIEYRKNLVADSGSLSFTPHEPSVGQVFQAQITGFPAPSIEVYQVNGEGGIEKKSVGVVSGTAGNYSITFSDTAKGTSKYIALTPQAKIKPATVQKKVFSNLRSPTNGADYLVITAREFAEEANRIAQYRAQQGIQRTKVVFVDDVYDEFNYGHFDPDAIRRFLISTDSLWAQPMPSYVVLFGDASWDYKDNLKGGRRNFVPSMGNPLSDSWLVSTKNDPFRQSKKAGRIPVATKAQASSFVDMIMAYEAASLRSLNKRFMFMASGFDSSETLRFQLFSDQLIRDYVSKDPIAGLGVRLYKTVEQVVGAEQTEEAKRLIAEGAVWVNFYGHAGTDIWGNGITSADQLENKEQKRHLVSDISCSTARFGEPLTEAFGEKLVLAANGAVGFMGSSGFGYEGPLRFLATQMFMALSDSLREIGAIHFRAKSALRDQFGTSSVLTRLSLQQFTLLADPATRIAVAQKPDYGVSPTDIIIDPAQPSESDPKISVSVPMVNVGIKGKDSVRVRFIHSTLDGSEPTIEVLRPPIGYSDTVTISDLSFRKSGSHRLQCIVDPDGLVDEVTKSNNSAEITFFVGAVQSVALRPQASSSVHSDSVVLLIQNPNLPSTAGYPAIFEIDVQQSFASPGKIVQQNVPQGIVTTEWKVPSGLLSEGVLYYWRARFALGADSTAWVVSFFTTDNFSPVSWQQDRSQQFITNQRSGVSSDSTVRLLSRAIPVQVYSAGFSDGNEAILTVDGQNISQGFSGRGYNIAVLDRNSGELKNFGSFSIYSDVADTTLTEPLIQFLSNIPFGETVLIGIGDEGKNNKTERLNQAIESIGSAMIRSLGFRASWAIIGRKGATIGSVPEMLKLEGSGPVTLSDTLSFQNVEGKIISPLIGPAASWKAAGYAADTAAGLTHVSLGLIRYRNDGTRDTLSNISLLQDSLAVLLPPTISTIQLIASLRSDSVGLTPHLRRWWADFQPAADLAINYQTARALADSVLEGNEVDVQATVFNIGEANADSVQFVLGAIENNVIVVSSQSTLSTLAPGDSTTVTYRYATSGKRGLNVIFLQIDPLNKVTEMQKSNNAFTIPLRVLGDGVPPSFDVTIDGARIFDGDYVSPNPAIVVSVLDNSPLPMTNPADIIVSIDERRITLGSFPDSLFETRSGPEKAVAIVRPTLSKGEHFLSVQVRDATGNFADTSARQVRFRVETESKLLNVFNYPNPFERETNFTFTVTGAGIPEELLVKVYTVAGRMIQEIRVPQAELRIGFNRILWDGRDREGDELANGVYFYKIVMVVGGRTDEAIQKLAKMK
ncbi:MAG: hypothetical protein HYY49_00380 [Ignavibacteriales bacterium]|nr:hypothetical protein [Ignavibacteriales bacterium]